MKFMTIGDKARCFSIRVCSNVPPPPAVSNGKCVLKPCFLPRLASLKQMLPSLHPLLVGYERVIRVGC